ncbi:uncharacterized protein G2W53_008857 [Senna tora]|uniref:Uncharacterized protein n=1 Tax=Senna tora TaxID=362788 RepID=A0A834WXX4_9FABA|nr:uncharacterized protein G2W53_008857 [Senna tora]
MTETEAATPNLNKDYDEIEGVRLN